MKKQTIKKLKKVIESLDLAYTHAISEETYNKIDKANRMVKELITELENSNE